MKKKLFLAAALAAVTLLAACGEPEEKPAGNVNPTAAPTSQPAANPTQAPAANTQAPAANTQAPAANTQAPAANTQAPAANTQVPAANTQAPAANTAAPTAPPAATPKPAATAKPTAVPKPAETPQPVQTSGNFDAIAGNWYSSANLTHGNLSLQISADGSSSLGTLTSDGDGRYTVSGTTKTLSLEKWADGSERLYFYDTYTYEDATYTRSN